MRGPFFGSNLQMSDISIESASSATVEQKDQHALTRLIVAASNAFCFLELFETHQCLRNSAHNAYQLIFLYLYERLMDDKNTSSVLHGRNIEAIGNLVTFIGVGQTANHCFYPMT